MTKLEEQLTAKILVLQEALKQIATGSEDAIPPFRAAPRSVLSRLANQALQNPTPQVKALQELVDAAKKLEVDCTAITNEEIVKILSVGVKHPLLEVVLATRNYKETL